MPRLNLLPRPSAHRLDQRRRFWRRLAMLLLAVGLLTLASHAWLNHQLRAQSARNARLQQAIAQGEQTLRRDPQLAARHRAALARRDWLAALQQRRGLLAHWLGQLAVQTPDGLYLREAAAQDGRLTLRGHAIAAASVSAFQQTLADQSVELLELRHTVADAVPVSEFVLAIPLPALPIAPTETP